MIHAQEDEVAADTETVLDDSFASGDEDSTAHADTAAAAEAGVAEEQGDEAGDLPLEDKMADDDDSFEFSAADFKGFDHIEDAEAVSEPPGDQAFVASHFDHCEAAELPNMPEGSGGDAVATHEEQQGGQARKEASAARRIQAHARRLSAEQTRHKLQRVKDKRDAARWEKEHAAAVRMQAHVRKQAGTRTAHRRRLEAQEQARELAQAKETAQAKEQEIETAMSWARKEAAAAETAKAQERETARAQAEAAAAEVAEDSIPDDSIAEDSIADDSTASKSMTEGFEDKYDHTEEANAPDQMTAAAATTKTGYAVGDRVEGYFDSEDDWYPGKITKVHANGTCDIEYDDGDFEEDVETSQIRCLSADNDRGGDEGDDDTSAACTSLELSQSLHELDVDTVVAVKAKEDDAADAVVAEASIGEDSVVEDAVADASYEDSFEDDDAAEASAAAERFDGFDIVETAAAPGSGPTSANPVASPAVKAEDSDANANAVVVAEDSVVEDSIAEDSIVEDSVVGDASQSQDMSFEDDDNVRAKATTNTPTSFPVARFAGFDVVEVAAAPGDPVLEAASVVVKVEVVVAEDAIAAEDSIVEDSVVEEDGSYDDSFEDDFEDDGGAVREGTAERPVEEPGRFVESQFDHWEHAEAAVPPSGSGGTGENDTDNAAAAVNVREASAAVHIQARVRKRAAVLRHQQLAQQKQQIADAQAAAAQEKLQREQKASLEEQSAVRIQTHTRKRRAMANRHNALQATRGRENKAATHIQGHARRRRAVRERERLAVAKAHQLKMEADEMARRQLLKGSILEDSFDDASAVDDSIVEASAIDESIVVEDADASLVDESIAYDDDSFDDDDDDDGTEMPLAKKFEDQAFDHTEAAARPETALGVDSGAVGAPFGAAVLDHTEAAAVQAAVEKNERELEQVDSDFDDLSMSESMPDDISIGDVLAAQEALAKRELKEEPAPEASTFEAGAFDHTEIALPPDNLEKELSSSHKSSASIMSDSDGGADDRSVGENDIFEDYDMVVDLEIVEEELLDTTIDSPTSKRMMERHHRREKEEDDPFAAYDHTELADNVDVESASEDFDAASADGFEEVDDNVEAAADDDVDENATKDAIAEQFFEIFLEDAIREAKDIMRQPSQSSQQPVNLSDSSDFDDDDDANFDDERVALLDTTGALLFNTGDFEEDVAAGGRQEEKEDLNTMVTKAMHRLPRDWSTDIRDAVDAVLDAAPSVRKMFDRVRQGTVQSTSIQDVEAFDDSVKEQAIQIFETLQVQTDMEKDSATVVRSVFDCMNEILRKEKRDHASMPRLTPKQRQVKLRGGGVAGLRVQHGFKSQDELATFFRAKVTGMGGGVSASPSLLSFQSREKAGAETSAAGVDATSKSPSIAQSLEGSLANLVDGGYLPEDAWSDCIRLEERVNNHSIRLAHKQFSFDLASRAPSLGLSDAEMEVFKLHADDVKVYSPLLYSRFLSL